MKTSAMMLYWVRLAALSAAAGACDSTLDGGTPPATTPLASPPIQFDNSLNAQVRTHLAGFSKDHLGLLPTDGAYVQAYCAVVINPDINAIFTENPPIPVAKGIGFWCDGETRAGNGVKPDFNTFFAIGSVSKTFVGALLAEDVLRNRRCYSDRVIDHLDGSAVPSWGTHSAWTDWTHKAEITLGELGDFHSGLPRREPNLPDPPGTYSTTDLLTDFMTGKFGCSNALPGNSQNTKTCDPSDPNVLHPGTENSPVNEGYSSFGFAMLSHAVTGSPTWHDRLAQEMLIPLGMNDTGISLASSHVGRMAAIDATDAQTPIDTYWAAAASGALYSTTHDMAKWLAWHMGQPPKILPLSSYTSPSTCGHFTDAYGFGSAVPDADPVVNEALRPRAVGGGAGTSQLGLPWATNLYTKGRAIALVDKLGDVDKRHSHYTSKIEIAVRPDGSRPTGVFVVGVGKFAMGGLADDLVDILEQW